MIRPLLPFATAALAACATPAAPPPNADTCPVMSSEGWRAWIDAMPGPQRPRLVVTGRVTLPWGGWRPVLELGPALRSEPPVQHIIFSARGSGNAAPQVVDTREVTQSFSALPRYRSVVIRCGNRVLAEISPVETAW